MGDILRANPYAELEAEAAERSTQRLIKQSQTETLEDPRVKAAKANATAAGFVLQEGQYIDLLNK